MKYEKCPECGYGFLMMHRLEDGRFVGQCKQCLHIWDEETQFFKDEVMHCELCDAQQLSDPDVSSNWRVIEMDSVPYYVCPKHFPSDRASQFAFAQAYKKVLSKLRVIHRQRKH